MAENKNNIPVEVDDDMSSGGSDMDIDPDMMDDGLDLGALLTTEEGDTIPTVLCDVGESVSEVARQISITNKLLVKLISKLG